MKSPCKISNPEGTLDIYSPTFHTYNQSPHAWEGALFLFVIKSQLLKQAKYASSFPVLNVEMNIVLVISPKLFNTSLIIAFQYM